MKTTAAGLALPALGRSAFAAEPLKVGFIYLGPIGDYGWTWAHDKGRKAMVDALKGQVVADYVENVKEDASAIPILKDLAQQGHKLIFTTSFGYMDQTIEVAKQFPDVKFEHCTGYKRADNVGTYNSRFHQGRAVVGTIAGMMSKTGMIGYLGSFKVPEVVHGRERLHAGGAGGQSEDHDQARDDRLLVRSGQGGRRGRDARQSRLRRHRPAHRQPGGACRSARSARSGASARRRHDALRAARRI